MVEIITKKRGGFRIYIFDLETKKSKSITLAKDHLTLEQIYKILADCIKS